MQLAPLNISLLINRMAWFRFGWFLSAVMARVNPPHDAGQQNTSIPTNTPSDTQPNLLMRAWMVAHLPPTATLQATVCCGGSLGEAAFRESLQPQYTSERHDALGLRTYYITGTCGGRRISRITCGCIGGAVAGVASPLCITVVSNTRAWQRMDLGSDEHLVSLDLDMPRLTEVACEFLACNSTNLEYVNLASLCALDELHLCPLWMH